MSVTVTAVGNFVKIKPKKVGLEPNFFFNSAAAFSVQINFTNIIKFHGSCKETVSYCESVKKNFCLYKVTFVSVQFVRPTMRYTLYESQQGMHIVFI